MLHTSLLAGRVSGSVECEGGCFPRQGFWFSRTIRGPSTCCLGACTDSEGHFKGPLHHILSFSCSLIRFSSSRHLDGCFPSGAWVKKGHQLQRPSTRSGLTWWWQDTGGGSSRIWSGYSWRLRRQRLLWPGTCRGKRGKRRKREGRLIRSLFRTSDSRLTKNLKVHVVIKSWRRGSTAQSLINANMTPSYTQFLFVYIIFIEEAYDFGYFYEQIDVYGRIRPERDH